MNMNPRQFPTYKSLSPVLKTQIAWVIASCVNTICCDKIFLTYKTAFRIFNLRKSNFLSIHFINLIRAVITV